MLAKLKLSQKIGGGFAIVLFLTAVVGFIGYSSMNDVEKIVSNTSDAYGIQGMMLQARTNSVRYAAKRTDADVENSLSLVGQISEKSQALKKHLTNDADKTKMEEVDKSAQSYRADVEEFKKIVVAQSEQMEKMTTQRKAMIEAVKSLEVSLSGLIAAAVEKAEKEGAERQWKADKAKNLANLIPQMRAPAIYYLFTRDTKYMDELREYEGKFNEICDELYPRFNDAINKKQIDDARKNLTEYVQIIEDITHAADEAAKQKLIDRSKVFAGQMVKIANEMSRDQADKLAKMKAELNASVEDRQDKLNIAKEVAMTVYESRGMALSYILYMKDEMLAATLAGIDESTKKINELIPRFKTQKNIDETKHTAELLVAYRQSFNEYARLMQVAAGIEGNMGVKGRALQAEVKDVVEGQTEEMSSTMASAVRTIFGGAIAAIVIGIVLAWLITLGIVRPVRVMVNALLKVSDGDLTIQVDIPEKDEIGQMAEALNTTVGGLCQIVSDIREAADQTASSSEELSAAAQNISSGAQNQAASVEEMSASIQELTASISQVAENAQSANQVSNETTTVAQKGGDTVRQSVEGMNLINESSTQISKIIGVISQIANQTNLLALNAAIEAASAGEHGMGFAVVADEVRKLAERAGQAAEEITQLIEESTRRVSEGSRLSEEVGQSLSAILEGIEKTASGMTEISAGTGEQAQTAQQVSKVIDNISAITEENSSSAEEMAASAEELAAQAQRMQGLVERFRVNKSSNMSASGATAVSTLPKPAAKPHKASVGSIGATPALSGAGALYHE